MKERWCSMSKNNFIVSRMFCCSCGQEGIPITRRKGQTREPGHLKKLYCIHCGKEWNHVEIRQMSKKYTYEDFEIEMLYNNFDSEGNRKVPFKQLKKEIFYNE